MTSITKNEGSVTPRSSNFELMRIVLILMILAIHYTGNGGFLEGTRVHTLNFYFARFVISCFAVAVNVFVLTTGYFACTKKTISLAKPVKLYALTVFYGVVIAALLIIVKRPEINWGLVQRFFPSVFYQWFVVYYCFLYLLIPFINKLIHAISQTQFKQLLLILIGFGCGVDTFFSATVMVDKGFGLATFVMLYLIGAYLRLYRNPMKRAESISLYLTCCFVISLLSIYTYTVWDYNNLLVVFGAIGFFEFFRSINLKYHPCINKLASYTFVTYIIHNNPFMLWVFYLKWFHAPWFWNDKFLICNLVTCVIGIWVFCIIVEKIRRILLGKIMDQQIMRITKEIG